MESKLNKTVKDMMLVDDVMSGRNSDNIYLYHDEYSNASRMARLEMAADDAMWLDEN